MSETDVDDDRVPLSVLARLNNSQRFNAGHSWLRKAVRCYTRAPFRSNLQVSNIFSYFSLRATCTRKCIWRVMMLFISCLVFWYAASRLICHSSLFIHWQATRPTDISLGTTQNDFLEEPENTKFLVCATYFVWFVEEQAKIGEHNPQFLPAITSFELSQQFSTHLILWIKKTWHELYYPNMTSHNPVQGKNHQCHKMTLEPSNQTLKIKLEII